MTFGEHTALVEEVIALAAGGRVLFATGPAEETDSAWITDDLRLAVETNGGNGEFGRVAVAPHEDVSGWGSTQLLAHNMATGEDLRIEEVADGLRLDWHDLTENLVAELLYTSEYWRRPDREALSGPLAERFFSSSLESDLRRRLLEILPAAEPLPGWESCADYLANEIVAVLWYCAENRAFNGLTDNFWERMFRLYQEGLWPCGWRGAYPAPGQCVAYRRPGAPVAWPPVSIREAEPPGEPG
jgi:hypothetical protein